MTIRSRNFRIEDQIWVPFAQKAKDMGISATAYLKLIIIKSTRDQQELIIDEPEVMEVPLKVQESLNSLSRVAKKAVKKRKA